MQAAAAPTPTASPAAPAPSAAEKQTRSKITESAHKFEASFLSIMMQSMFKDIDLGGGQGGEAFKSFMMDSVAKKMTAAGGLGLSASVQTEMLKLQGLR